MKKRFKRCWPVGLLLAAALEFVPGRCTIKPVAFEYPLTSTAGHTLHAFESVNFFLSAGFHKPGMQRLSRNVELAVPAGTQMHAAGTLISGIRGTNVVATVSALKISTSQPAAFYYRGIRLADVFKVQTANVSEAPALRAAVRFRLLSALVSLPRYRRPRDVERNFSLPEQLDASVWAAIKDGHEIELNDGGALQLRGIRNAGLSLRLTGGNSAEDGYLLVLSPGSSLQVEALQVSGTNPAFMVEAGKLKLTPSGGIALTDDFRMQARNFSISVDGVLKGLLAEIGGSLLTVQEINLGAAVLTAGPLASGEGWYLRTAEELRAGNIDWRTTGDDGLKASFSKAVAALRRFNLTVDPHQGVSGNDISGYLNCAQMDLSPDENQSFRLGHGLTVDFAAQRIGLGTNLFSITNGEIRAEANVLDGELADVLFRTGGLTLQVDIESESLERFTFDGSLRSRERTVLEMKDTDSAADLSVLASARTLNFSGDQDCLRVGLPWSRTRMDIKQLEQLVKDAFNAGRAGIRDESRRYGRFLLDVRRIRRITFKENAAEVRADGRVSLLGPRILGWRTRIRVSFTADMLAEFEVPAGILTGDSEIGVKLSLERINFKNFPNEFDQYIPDIIEVFQRGALVDTSTGIGTVTDELPFGLIVNRARLYPSGREIMLDLAVTLELGQCAAAAESL